MSGTNGRYISRALPDAEALRGLLDEINEAGEMAVVVGIDAKPSPFLITLVGPYAESAHVLFDSPWQSDVDYGERVNGEWVPKLPHCEECLAQVNGIEDLSFPVIVLSPPVVSLAADRG